MTTSDMINAKGQVSPCFVNLKTGEKMPWEQRHNTISFDATHAMALAFGGDRSMIPNKIGFVYGEADASISFATISRQQSWSDLVYELQEKGANLQVQPFSYSPSFTQISRPAGRASGSGSSGASGASGDSSKDDTAVVSYAGWAVTFHAHSDSVTPGAIGYSSDSMIFTSGNAIFQALLLNKTNDKYTILARVSLDHGGTYYTKPENFEVALDWTIKFF